ncbi:hypothetical protein B0T25DRAFT_10473 [Lasiosphaeria hispida]|uniref:Uncharacterized protein n=1 Tax=Lasiosphaeria hispida TaxID=260671 RepID=A0AAJ0HTJ7_9PEZI|nr:hypothetical protein B0T25DRAFT_10473 [Lasiosphaeria hispida]
MDPQMLPPHFQGQPPFHHIRHHTPSASPPIPNGVFGAHPAHGGPRSHTPQPQMGSRPSSRNDMRRMGPGMVGQPMGPQGPPQPQAVNGYAFMPQPAIYNPQNPTMPPHSVQQAHPQYPYPPPQAHTHQMQSYMEEQRRSSLPPSFPPQHQAQHQPPQVQRHSVSPPQPPPPQLPQQHIQHQHQQHQQQQQQQQQQQHQQHQQQHQQHQQQHQQHQQHQQPQHQQMPPTPPLPQVQVHPMRSPPQPQHQPTPPQQQDQSQHHHQHQHQNQHLPPPSEPQPPAPVESKIKPEPVERARQPLLLDTAIKKQPQRKQGSIFTPIDENRSILSQHLAAFHPDSKSDGINRSQSIDVGSVSRANVTSSPPQLQRSSTQGQAHIKRNGSMSSIPETTFTPPSRSNSLRVGANASRPRLKVQIPDEPSDGGSATAESGSPRNTTSTDVTSQPSRRPTDSHSSGVVLPPPSPSASTLLSAGASGPPNPFARPPPQQHQNNNNNMNIDTPVSALPSRFLNNEFLPSPSSFYPDWNFRGNDSNTLPSPLNFATPVVGTGPSFLRDDTTSHKRKSPEISGNGAHHDHHMDIGGEAKRVKVDS